MLIRVVAIGTVTLGHNRGEEKNKGIWISSKINLMRSIIFLNNKKGFQSNWIIWFLRKLYNTLNRMNSIYRIRKKIIQLSRPNISHMLLNLCNSKEIPKSKNLLLIWVLNKLARKIRLLLFDRLFLFLLLIWITRSFLILNQYNLKIK